ncbi:MAG TPA: DUF47 domain-containing protein [Pseudogracilibacillus sp.]|nr:DUF47 domain-containing protein [Pseudogracilibacillus sp.]
MFFKKEDKFSVYLSDLSKNLVESTQYFVDYKIESEQDRIAFTKQMEVYEHAGDAIVHQVIHDLNQVFITPIEREDILALATHIDDVLDGLEDTAILFNVYQIERIDQFMRQFVEYIQQSVIEIDKAIELINQKKLIDMRDHIIKIKDFESKCDDVYRTSLKHLFQDEKDPIAIIKYKEIYEELEAVADSCEAVAKTFDAIIMKNA